MNLPIIPGQNKRGKNGASVVNVPARTGTKISPAAIFAAFIEDIFPLLLTNIRCVFSITTMASSTIIPSPKRRAKSTIKFKVTSVPVINSAAGKKRKATNILSGTDKATKKALVTPIKNMRIKSTNTNPITIAFTSSLKELFVPLLWSPVIVTFKLEGMTLPLISSTDSFILSEVEIRFSPARLTIFSVTTFFPLRRA